MARLKSREKFIPGGFRVYIPETKWQSPPNASFMVIVSALIAHRQANPYLTQKNGWSTDPAIVADEVDAYQARLCQQNGWTAYITSGGGSDAVPFPRRPLSQRLAAVAAGGETLIQWLKSGAEAVAPELANNRAIICVTCPQNSKGDWTSFFTVPVSNAIRKALEQRKEMNLSTPHDAELGVCSACSCPLPLKVHMPIKKILAKLPAESKSALDPRCWILAEERG